MFLFTNDAGNWAAWGTWAYVVLTGILAVAAWRAFRATQDQLQEARRSREAALRPVPVVTEFGFARDPYNGKSIIRAVVTNVGPGPTIWLNTNVHAASITDWEGPPEQWQLGETYAAFETSGAGVESGGVRTAWAPLALPSGTRVAMTVRLQYGDIFGNRFDDKHYSLSVAP